MSRTEFLVIEKILRQLRDRLPLETWLTVVNAFALELQERYPTFDIEKFTFRVSIGLFR